jgi:CcmD family protein
MHDAMMKRISVALLVWLTVAGFAMAPPAGLMTRLSAQEQPPQQQEEFIPIDQLPPQDQLPAAPLLVTAYSFVVLALFAYVLSVARRLGVVQRELDRLQSDLKRGRT